MSIYVKTSTRSASRLDYDTKSIIKIKSYHIASLTFGAWCTTESKWPLDAPSGYSFICLINYHHYVNMSTYDKLSVSYVNVNAQDLMIGWFNSDNAISRPVDVAAVFVRTDCITVV